MKKQKKIRFSQYFNKTPCLSRNPSDCVRVFGTLPLQQPLTSPLYTSFFHWFGPFPPTQMLHEFGNFLPSTTAAYSTHLLYLKELKFGLSSELKLELRDRFSSLLDETKATVPSCDISGKNLKIYQNVPKNSNKVETTFLLFFFLFLVTLVGLKLTKKLPRKEIL